ncbi:2OG-Fe(II) oxygenase [Ectopseudomonas hydrolytica]|uniref:2OG-Fe(II) oxygenase n=1 Tax=Ectopseudomonas hydrolytica TaxID=2493633 RepID=A0ABY5A9R5_9GAMM|nr:MULTISPECIES: 2OG-Fe(II) oxygenase [Pseudomonas]ATH80065.1 proline hydroxylase [Pseudomonas mendocina]MBA4245400.1 proline hydroxylase [Pseudomonas sp.]MDH0098704.1 2OG-Fe(II) oxygenase [Pseudomonas sp. GD04158]USR39673.1 2OG-Fe(II) oxygenase [Pseudomonas hydrolytica]UTH36360.1 2OG-Fe(II) oxygenase [Pseudomonas sp. KHPS1]
MNGEHFPKLSGNEVMQPESSGLLINYDALSTIAAELGEIYRANEPFPHIVIDDFLPASTLARLLAEYPQDQSLPIWNEATHKDKQTGEYVQKDKRNIRNQLAMPPSYRQLIWELNSHYFLDFLASMTGIDNLIPDPNLRGAGIHQIGRGGFLKVHADFATHREFGLDRRLNFLLYLNPNWPEEYGGHLELWDSDMQGPPKRVLPILNRCVVFSTTATSYHGHPKPLNCPDGIYRKSLALYYYTNGRPTGEAEPGFATLWQDVPEAYR